MLTSDALVTRRVMSTAGDSGGVYSDMPRCLISLGANLGDAQQTLATVLSQLSACEQFHEVRCSALHVTAPIGGPADQPEFCNAAASFQTDLAPLAVLKILRAWEQSFGRERRERWGPRTLDLDLLLYDEQKLSTENLIVPHPRMAFRRFVLAPAVEVAGQMREPHSGLTVQQLWENLNTPPPYVALAGACWIAKQYIAGAVVADLNQRNVPASVSQTRGVTVLGAAEVDDLEHPFVEHFVELAPRLGDDMRTLLATPQRSLISSFWPGEVTLGAELWFRGAAQAAALAACRTAFDGLPQPRLLVYLETGDDLLIFPPGAARPDAEAHARRLRFQRDALDQLLARPHGVPVLRLAADRPEAAIEELTAAVLAMQPTSA